MRYYEIVFIIDINYKNNIEDLINEYCEKIKSNSILHKLEKIGIRNLAYPIKKNKKAYYVIFNIECDIFFIKNLEKDIKINEIIIRYIILNIKNLNIKKSKLLIETEKLNKI